MACSPLWFHMCYILIMALLLVTSRQLVAHALSIIQELVPSRPSHQLYSLSDLSLFTSDMKRCKGRISSNIRHKVEEQHLSMRSEGRVCISLVVECFWILNIEAQHCLTRRSSIVITILFISVVGWIWPYSSAILRQCVYQFTMYVFSVLFWGGVSFYAPKLMVCPLDLHLPSFSYRHIVLSNSEQAWL